MCIASKNSKKKIMHRAGCPYAKRIAEANRIELGAAKHAAEDGWRHCSCCAPLAAFLRRDRRKMDLLARDTGLAFELNPLDGTLEMRTDAGEWKLGYNLTSKHITLYHRDTFIVRGEKGPAITGYHVQNVSKDSVYGYALYAVQHDNYRRMYPAASEETLAEYRETARKRREKKMEKRMKRLRGRRKGRHESWGGRTYADSVRRLEARDARDEMRELLAAV